MDRKGYQDLLHLTEAERSVLLERMRLQARSNAMRSTPKGERRRDRRWEYSSPDMAMCVEHPGGGLARYLVWSRDLSAGGMAFVHGGFLHVGSRCKIAIPARDGQRQIVSGHVTSCRLIEGHLHSIGLKFDQRVDPSQFLCETDGSDDETKIASPDEQARGFVAKAHAAATSLKEAMKSDDLATVRVVCEAMKSVGGSRSFEELARLAGQIHSMLDDKSIKDVTKQLQSLSQMCERATVPPRSTG